jgi:excisionase family DNA binding protein
MIVGDGRATRSYQRPFTPKTLAERWGVSAQTIRNEIDRGALPAFRVGRAYRIPAEAVMAREAGASLFGEATAADNGLPVDPASDGKRPKRKPAPRLRPKPCL